MSDSQPILQLEGIVKRFGEFTAVDGIDLNIEEGEFFTIVGPSGSGKTTIIRLLVGLDRPSSGAIRLRGRTINDMPAIARNKGRSWRCSVHNMTFLIAMNRSMEDGAITIFEQARKNPRPTRRAS